MSKSIIADMEITLNDFANDAGQEDLDRFGFSAEDRAKMSTVFISNISGGIEDGWMESLLRIFGVVNEWKRAPGPDGSLGTFGIVKFEGPDGVVRLMKCFESKQMQNIKIPSLDGTTWKRLAWKVNETSKELIERYKLARGDVKTDHVLSKKAIVIISRMVNDLASRAPPIRKDIRKETEEILRMATIDKVKAKELVDQKVASLIQSSMEREEQMEDQEAEFKGLNVFSEVEIQKETREGRTIKLPKRNVQKRVFEEDSEPEIEVKRAPPEKKLKKTVNSIGKLIQNWFGVEDKDLEMYFEHCCSRKLQKDVVLKEMENLFQNNEEAKKFTEEVFNFLY